MTVLQQAPSRHILKKCFRPLVLGSSIFLLSVLMCLITNVATSLNDEDKLVFRSNYQQYENAKSGLNPEQEIHLVREIQSAVLGRVPFGPGIPAYSSREPSDVLKRDTGLCYDRSRLFDKLFIFAGFETRHIYILYKPIIAEYTLPAWLAIFLPGTESHAVTEVRTSQGWLLVDSNNAWISVSRQSKVFPADRLWNHKDEFDSMPDYFDRPYSAIRGLYSRRGHLYRPYIPFPQFNWPDFFKYHIY